LVDVSAFTVFVMMTGRLDEASLAASNTGFAINNLAFMPLIGISTAASVLVGQYQGRRESDYANRAAWSAIKLGWCYMAIAALSFILFPSAYLKLFRSSKANYTMDELLAIGRPMMAMMAAWGMFDAVSIIFSGALKGAGDTRFVMLYMLIFGWCVWLPAEIIVLTHGGSILSAWLILTIYILILAIGFFWRWQSGKWRTIKLIEHEAPAMMPRQEDPVLF
jgi:MATE family multidrug resistance protein